MAQTPKKRRGNNEKKFFPGLMKVSWNIRESILLTSHFTMMRAFGSLSGPSYRNPRSFLSSYYENRIV